MIKTVQDRTWTNWSQTFHCQPQKILYPASIEDVCTLVKEAADRQKNIRVVGAGHSFTNLVQTNDWLVSLDLLNGIEKIDEANGTATVLGGTRLYEIGNELGRLGYSQENLGDINVQSIAGALSTGTHGTGREFGIIATQVIELTLVNAAGEIFVVSEKENATFFHACLVSLGSLGIIVKVVIKIIKSPVYDYISEKIPYTQLEENLEHYINTNRHFEFFLFPYSDLVQIKTMDLSVNNPQSLTLHNWKNLILENYLFFILSEVCRIFPKSSRFISRLSSKGVGSTSISAHSYQLFATPRMVIFREIEYFIPLQYMKPAIQEIRECIEENKYNVHFPLECRTVKADDIWLSPAYKRDSAVISFHMYKGMPYEKYFNDMEKIMEKYEGRPHWGKMHNQSTFNLHSLYPKLADFLAIRQKLDPNGIFMNDYLQGLLQESLDEKQFNSL